ncbi:hypothetical protein M5689_017643 [Euphorbia peplus]|nr:hypothetical protein M5689_017643 [Euphorbia peplus]
MSWVKKIVRVGDFTDFRNMFRFTPLQKPDRDDFGTKKEYQEYQIYASEYEKSYGFDIKHFVPNRFGYMTILKPVCLSDSDEVYEACKKAVQSVLHYLDQKGEHNLEFVKVIKAYYCAEYLFYVTFEARDKGSPSSTSGDMPC